ncbi:MAG: YraN family protein [Bacteroidales bacterium]|nr:YraN family protein [Bacteroidales bacterium]
MAEHNDLGKLGEDEAEKYLEEKGYEILARNWRGGNHELDLVARKGKLLIVAEVKTRRSAMFGEPEEFVTRTKQKSIIKAANAFVLYKNIDLEVRFDIISIVMSNTEKRIYHIEDAFYPTL